MPPAHNRKGRPGQEAPSAIQVRCLQHSYEQSLAQVALIRGGLVNAGVPADVDADAALAPVITRVDGSFEYVEHGEPAIILPVSPEAPDDADAVAFYLTDPSKCWTNAGAPLLNYEAVARAEWFGEPLVLHESPLAYLKAGARGAVILDWATNLHWWFSGVAKIECSSAELQRRLAYVLRKPRFAPRIVAAESAARQAA